MSSSVETSSDFGVLFVGVVEVLSTLGFVFDGLFSSGVTIGDSSSIGGTTTTSGISVGVLIDSGSTHRMRLQLVSEREMRARGKRRECFIGEKYQIFVCSRVYLGKEKSKKFCNSRLFAIIPARARSSAGRVPVFETDGRRFEPYRAHHFVTSVCILDP